MSKFMTLAPLVLCTIPFAGTAVAEEHGDTVNEQMEPEECISLTRLASTDVVDERNVLFHMRDGTIYRNKLAHRCPGMRFEDTFMYRTSLGRLCDLDRITILHDIGFGFSHGPSCGLGEFHPISEDEAKMLKKREDSSDS